MFIQADTHTHTIASTHAYSTVLEMARAAKEKGLRALAITDHATGMPDSPHIWHFHNIKRCIPPNIDGVEMLCGVEANIMDYEGNLDFPEKELRPLDWVVASIHIHCVKPSTEEDITNAYIGAAKNPYVDVIGHCAWTKFKFDYEKVFKVCKEYNTFVEINESSILNKKGIRENYVEIIRLCKKLEVPVIVNSDAHIGLQVGEVGQSLQMLSDQSFPEKLIANSEWDKLREYVIAKRGSIFE